MPEFVSIILRRSGRKEVWRTLPVTPSTITIDKPQGVRKDIIVNVGQIADIGVKRPKMISFNSFFPRHYDTYVNPQSLSGSIQTPDDWVKEFERFEQQVLDLVITQPHIYGTENKGIAGKYLLDHFSIKHIGGRGGDIDYSARFIYHESVSIRRVDVSGSTPVEVTNVRQNTAQIARNYFVREEDSLITISRVTGVPVDELMAQNGIRNSYLATVPDVVLNISVHNEFGIV